MIDILQNKIKKFNIATIILESLPDQGCVEVQRDAPGKEHVWHDHNADETLIIMSGNLKIYWGNGQRLCYPGDIVIVKSGTPYGSEALQNGATYLKAAHRVYL